MRPELGVAVDAGVGVDVGIGVDARAGVGVGIGVDVEVVSTGTNRSPDVAGAELHAATSNMHRVSSSSPFTGVR